MNTELFIENFRLDISKDISTLLTFGLDDLKDFSARSTTWSKTIVLPGTGNNNKLFGHIFQIGQSNLFNPSEDNVGFNFNASKSAGCIIFQDNLQTFTGVLRLLQINVIKGRIEYEVSVFGKLAGLNVALSGALLEQLDFSAYDHTYNETNIAASWDNAPGTGYYYPLIDYGNYGRNGGSTGKHDWDIRTFRPALYVREYIDKMFTAAGFRFDAPLFETARFKSLIIPYNRAKLTTSSSQFFEASVNNHTIIDSGTTLVENLHFDFVTGTGFTYHSGPKNFEYTGAATVSFSLAEVLSGTYKECFLQIRMFRNGGIIDLKTFNYATVEMPWSYSANVTNITLTTGDLVFIEVTAVTGLPSGFFVKIGGTFSASSDNQVYVPVDPTDTIAMNGVIPKNIRQVDFLVSIVKLFNLYVYEDRFDETLIYLKPYIDFYSTDSTDSIDWTYKLNRDKVFKVRPMSELNAKKYEFKWKSDSDYYNDLYRKRYGQGYGDYIFDSQFEFAEQAKAFELIFSSTPLVGYANVGEDKIYPTIFKRTGPDLAAVEENTDSNIRIMQTKKIDPVTSWDIMDDVTVLSSHTVYGYAGHFDDPGTPVNDLNFGVLKELFFTFNSGDLGNTQFNVYWSSYMAEITDKDSKLFSGSFYLTPKDILELDFSKFVHIDGILYRLSKISDYNASKPADCKVDLLKVNYLIY